eukprot:TRINITY_DN10566_c0_g1_i1.p1 TRINITY_DN10566_c0_g1~~TRINITY_DN10566_c0_g1_i1.p1  ORF type:complete len:113 (+),score=21.92 TRINITY_DN10566_c0_g1_i1:236-574(+)
MAKSMSLSPTFPLDDVYYSLELDAEDYKAELQRRLDSKKQKETDRLQKVKERESAVAEEEKRKSKKSSSSHSDRNAGGAPSRELRSLLSDVNLRVENGHRSLNHFLKDKKNF